MTVATASSKDDPKGLWLGFLPGRDPADLAPLVNQPLDFVVFGATANGTVPCAENRFSLLPTIESLVKRGVPVFIVPELNSASTGEGGQSRLDLSRPYSSQEKLVETGASILLKDFTLAGHVMDTIRAEYLSGQRGLALGEAVCERLNTSEFNTQQRAIRAGRHRHDSDLQQKRY